MYQASYNESDQDEKMSRPAFAGTGAKTNKYWDDSSLWLLEMGINPIQISSNTLM